MTRQARFPRTGSHPGEIRAWAATTGTGTAHPRDMAGPRCYRIRVDGTLGSRFTERVGEMQLGSEGATTVLSGVCPDASALYGVLDRCLLYTSPSPRDG